MSFVTTLPLEIVHNIFLRSIDLSQFTAWELNIRNRRLHDYPNLLTSICHSWADAALSCPLLWSTLPILIRGADHDEKGEQIYIECFPPLSEVERWIDLAGSATPLEISVRQWDNQHVYSHSAQIYQCYAYQDCMNTIMDDILLPNHARCMKLSIHLRELQHPYEEFLSVLTPLTRASEFTELKEFSVYGLRTHSSTDPRPHAEALAHVISNSPQLLSLELRDVDLPPQRMACLKSAIPWDRLSSVFLIDGIGNGGLGNEYSAQEVLEIMRDDGCPSLERLGISMHGCGEGFGHALRIRHDRLRELDLLESCPRQFLSFLPHVTLPNLRGLTIPTTCSEQIVHGRHEDCTDVPMPQLQSAVLALIERSQCKLEKLHWYEEAVIPNSEHQLGPLLTEVEKSIEDLQIIVGVDELETLLQWLTVKSRTGSGDIKSLKGSVSDVEETIRFPRLKRLNALFWVSADAPPGKYSQPVFNLIKSRWDAPKDSDSWAHMRYINIGMWVAYPQDDRVEQRAAALRLMGPAPEKVLSELRQLSEAQGIAFGNVDHLRRIRVSVGSTAVASLYGISKPYFDTWLPNGVPVPLKPLVSCS